MPSNWSMIVCYHIRQYCIHASWKDGVVEVELVLAEVRLGSLSQFGEDNSCLRLLHGPLDCICMRPSHHDWGQQFRPTPAARGYRPDYPVADSFTRRDLAGRRWTHRLAGTMRDTVHQMVQCRVVLIEGTHTRSDRALHAVEP